MQVAAAPAQSSVLASQTIEIAASALPGGGTTMWFTDRDFEIAGPADGIDTFTSFDDAVDAARTLSRGSMPGMAVMEWRGGFRLHDVRTESRRYIATNAISAPTNPLPPATRLIERSEVPFAAGNFRWDAATTANPAVVRDQDLAALVDGDIMIVPGDETFGGRRRLQLV